MACPAGPAAELATLLPPGPMLELCCGVGGLTRELARAGRQVLAVDHSLERLKANRTNLAALGLERRVSYLCCDLQQAALRAPARRPPLAAAVLDPDWSPPGAPPEEWAPNVHDMDPPADDLVRLALSLSPLVVIRLPRDLVIDSASCITEDIAINEIGLGGKRWRWLALRQA